MRPAGAGKRGHKQPMIAGRVTLTPATVPEA